MGRSSAYVELGPLGGRIVRFTRGLEARSAPNDDTVWPQIRNSSITLHLGTSLLWGGLRPPFEKGTTLMILFDVECWGDQF